MINRSEKGVSFIPFKEWHAYQMDWIEKDDLIGSLRENKDFFKELESNGCTVTMVYSNCDSASWMEEPSSAILGIITTIKCTPYHCYVSMFMSTALQHNFDKLILKGLQGFVNKLTKKYCRVSAEGKASNLKLLKLMNRLGFSPECTMKKFGFNGEDYILYSIVRDK